MQQREISGHRLFRDTSHTRNHFSFAKIIRLSMPRFDFGLSRPCYQQKDLSHDQKHKETDAHDPSRTRRYRSLHVTKHAVAFASNTNSLNKIPYRNDSVNSMNATGILRAETTIFDFGGSFNDVPVPVLASPPGPVPCTKSSENTTKPIPHNFRDTHNSQSQTDQSVTRDVSDRIGTTPGFHSELLVPPAKLDVLQNYDQGEKQALDVATAQSRLEFSGSTIPETKFPKVGYKVVAEEIHVSTASAYSYTVPRFRYWSHTTGYGRSVASHDVLRRLRNLSINQTYGEGMKAPQTGVPECHPNLLRSHREKLSDLEEKELPVPNGDSVNAARVCEHREDMKISVADSPIRESYPDVQQVTANQLQINNSRTECVAIDILSLSTKPTIIPRTVNPQGEDAEEEIPTFSLEAIARIKNELKARKEALPNRRDLPESSHICNIAACRDLIDERCWKREMIECGHATVCHTPEGVYLDNGSCELRSARITAETREEDREQRKHADFNLFDCYMCRYSVKDHSPSEGERMGSSAETASIFSKLRAELSEIYSPQSFIVRVTCVLWMLTAVIPLLVTLSRASGALLEDDSYSVIVGKYTLRSYNPFSINYR